MDDINTLIIRLKYALDSLDDDDQQKMVDIVETFAAQINRDNFETMDQPNNGGKNGN